MHEREIDIIIIEWMILPYFYAENLETINYVDRLFFLPILTYSAWLEIIKVYF